MLVGVRQKTEDFEGSRSRTLSCEKCGAPRMHRERRVVEAVTGFLVPLANVRRRTVWECASCGSQLAEREQWFGDQGETLAGQVISGITGVLSDPALGSAQQLLREARAGIERLAGAPTPGPQPEARPADPEWEALLRRLVEAMPEPIARREAWREHAPEQPDLYQVDSSAPDDVQLAALRSLVEAAEARARSRSDERPGFRPRRL